MLVEESKRVAIQELGFSVASGSFVVFYLAIHMRSPLVAILGMMQTIIAFPIAYFFYRVVFQITYFASMNLLSIYIILGISADDLFVFYDAWRQSKYLIPPGPKLLYERMALATRRASKAIFITSFTTASAFVATSMSEVIPIRAFGTFSALLVVIDFGLTLTVFPAFLILHHRITKLTCYRRRVEKCSLHCQRTKKVKTMPEVSIS